MVVNVGEYADLQKVGSKGSAELNLIWDIPQKMSVSAKGGATF